MHVLGKKRRKTSQVLTNLKTCEVFLSLVLIRWKKRVGLFSRKYYFSLIGIFIDIVSPPEPADPPLQRKRILKKVNYLLYQGKS